MSSLENFYHLRHSIPRFSFIATSSAVASKGALPIHFLIRSTNPDSDQYNLAYPVLVNFHGSEPKFTFPSMSHIPHAARGRLGRESLMNRAEGLTYFGSYENRCRLRIYVLVTVSTLPTSLLRVSPTRASMMRCEHYD